MNIDLILKSFEIDTLIIPSCDEFLSEYVDPEGSLMKFISGFDGSNGVLVLQGEKNALFTDSRYVLQAKKQLDLNYWEVFNLAEISVFEYIKKFSKIGIISDYFSQHQIENFKQNNDIKSISREDILKAFGFKFEKKESQVFDFDIKFCGVSHIEKLSILRRKLNNESFFIADPQSICWLLNIRGNDLENTPILNCFALVLKDVVFVFSNSTNFTKEGVVFCDFSELESKLFGLEAILFDKSEVNGRIYEMLQKNCKTLAIQNPIKSMKYIKNKTEINGFINAHKRDGFALNNLIKWVKNQERTNELEVVEMSKKVRQNGEFFHSMSFDTIAGFNSNGAIIHYRANDETNSEIFGDGVLLIDSGAQYFDGTTDVTRTIAIGNPSKVFPDLKRHYTLVLKSLLMLSNLHFPCGTNGVQLDAIARFNLWQNGLDFGHGTGHGVGHFLSVHEGPCGISKSMSSFKTPLQEGMILSIEPGLYLDGKYGIRLENLVLVERSNKFENFLQFKTLTEVDFDEELIDHDLLKS